MERVLVLEQLKQLEYGLVEGLDVVVLDLDGQLIKLLLRWVELVNFVRLGH